MNIANSLLDTNFTPGREGQSIRNIVLHTMVGTISDSDAHFRDPAAQMSAHYGVALNGEIKRWVLEADTAWQAGNRPANLESIGIQHEDNANPGDSVRTDAMYIASAELVADLCHRYDIPCKLVDVTNYMPNEPGIVLHHQVSLTPTDCPNGLDCNRILAQAQAILEPPGEPKPVVYDALPAPKKLRVRDMANGGAELWDLTFLNWADVKSVQHLNAGDEFYAVAVAHHPLGGEYYMSDADYNNSGQSDVPFKPWGANVDDLEDYPVEAQAPETQPVSTSEPAPTPDVTPTPEQEIVSTPEVTAAPEQSQESATTTEGSVAVTSEPAPPETTAPEPTPPAPQIAYSELDAPLDFVTSKAPTNVYDLDTETFAKITAVKELAEGTPFKAISQAMVVDGSETIYYLVDDQNQAINEADLQPAPAPQEQTTPIETTEPPEPDPRATQEPFSENEGPVPVTVIPPDPNKWMDSYGDFDEPFKVTPNGTYEIEDSQDPSHKEILRQLTNDKPNIVNIVGHFYKDGQEYYLSEKCAYPVDTKGDPLPRVWLGINPTYLDEDVDSLSSETLEQSSNEKAKAKEKVIAGAATLAGLVSRAIMKPKKE